MKRLAFLLLIFLPLFLFATEKTLPIQTYPTQKAWERIGVRDHYGIDLPLLGIQFSLLMAKFFQENKENYSLSLN